ncbi:MAG: hypothetical protein H0W08_20000 [Acidobacteria bacterium]|nr:hypothetical protein [Acidobacteriota bacterium]
MRCAMVMLSVAALVAAAVASDVAARETTAPVTPPPGRTPQVEKPVPKVPAPDAPKPKMTHIRPPGSGPLSPVQERLRLDTALASRLDGRLPPGFDLMSAALGFRSLEQFVAALNASTNLDIPFATLKLRVVNRRMSLGGAIKALRASVDSRREAARAEREAAAIIGSGGVRYRFFESSARFPVEPSKNRDLTPDFAKERLPPRSYFFTGPR